MKELIEGGFWQMILGILFTGGFIGALVTWAVLRRQSNNNLLATLSARSNNWLRATVNGTNEVVNLYQFGNTWVGRNAAGQFVTLKKL